MGLVGYNLAEHKELTLPLPQRDGIGVACLYGFDSHQLNMKQCPKCKTEMVLYQLLGGKFRWECPNCKYEGEIE